MRGKVVAGEQRPVSRLASIVQLTTIACILLSQLPTILVGQFVERRVLVLVLAVE